jgi:glucokinase
MRCSACSNLQAPVVEELASGPGLARAYAAATGAPVGSAERVLAEAASGDAAACVIVEDAARLLGASVGLLINMLDPEAVVIGGGLGTADGPYWPALIAAARTHIFAEDCREIPILRAALGPDAGIVGAAASFV